MLWRASLQYREGHRVESTELKGVTVTLVQGDGATRLHLALGDRRVHTLHDAKLSMLSEYSMSWTGYDMLENGQKTFQNVVISDPQSEAGANAQLDFESLQDDAAKVVQAYRNMDELDRIKFGDLDSGLGDLIETMESNGRQGWWEKTFSKDSSGLATPGIVKVTRTPFDASQSPTSAQNMNAAAERGLRWSELKKAYVDIHGRIHSDKGMPTG
jgi:hypothetical protein